jgi:type I restriction enzyme S subunit
MGFMSLNTMQKIPDGYQQTEVGIIPLDWELLRFGDLVNYIKGYPFKSSEYTDSGIRIVRVSDTSFTTIKNENPIYISEKSKSKYKKWMLVTGNIIFTTVGSKPPMYDSLVGKAILAKEEHSGFLLNQNAVLIKPKLEAVNISNLLINHFRTERYIDHIEIIYRGNANQASITLEGLFEFQIPLPSSPKEQTAIANALSDVDALLSELEKLIAKKQAIKTATMQQLLTGKTRLPAFAYYSEADENQTLPEGAKHGQRKYSTGTNVNVEACDDGSQSGGMESRRKGTKPSELGEIPEDWEVRAFGQVMRIRHGKDQKAIQVNDGQYPIFGTGGKMGSTNTPLYDKPSVLIGRKGTINKPRFTDRPFWTVDTLFYSEVANKESAKFIYYKFCMIDWMQYNEASGVPSLNASTIESVLASFPEYEEQTAIAAILSDIDEDIQTLEQRLKKTRQIKQGMMQELLTGKTRLPFDKSEVQGVTMEEA